MVVCTLLLEGKSTSFRLCSSWSDLKILQWFFYCFWKKIQTLCHGLGVWTPAGFDFPSGLTSYTSLTDCLERTCSSSSSTILQHFLLQNSLLSLPGIHILSFCCSSCTLILESGLVTSPKRFPFPQGPPLLLTFSSLSVCYNFNNLFFSFVCLFIFPH